MFLASSFSVLVPLSLEFAAYKALRGSVSFQSVEFKQAVLLQRPPEDPNPLFPLVDLFISIPALTHLSD